MFEDRSSGAPQPERSRPARTSTRCRSASPTDRRDRKLADDKTKGPKETPRWKKPAESEDRLNSDGGRRTFFRLARERQPVSTIADEKPKKTRRERRRALRLLAAGRSAASTRSARSAPCRDASSASISRSADVYVGVSAGAFRRQASSTAFRRELCARFIESEAHTGSIRTRTSSQTRAARICATIVAPAELAASAFAAYIGASVDPGRRRWLLLRRSSA